MSLQKVKPPLGERLARRRNRDFEPAKIVEAEVDMCWSHMESYTGWWFGTFFHILGIIIPTD